MPRFAARGYLNMISKHLKKLNALGIQDNEGVIQKTIDLLKVAQKPVNTPLKDPNESKEVSILEDHRSSLPNRCPTCGSKLRIQ